MSCPCGLTKEDLFAFKCVDTTGACIARRKDKSTNQDGSFVLCGELAVDHPSAPPPDTQGNN